MISIVNIESKSWQTFLAKKSFIHQLDQVNAFLEVEMNTGKTIYPQEKHVFEALNLCAFEKVKVILLGQDPYHNPGQAHGLSFSVPKGIKAPPSLVNIFKEIKSDVGIQNEAGNLSAWADQGVLLLNAILTVNKNEPASHRLSAWEAFTDKLIQDLSREKSNLVFMLWGKFAQGKAPLIDGDKHLILEASHPSPFSAYRGFFGCQHFSNANRYLKEHGKEAIDWIV